MLELILLFPIVFLIAILAVIVLFIVLIVKRMEDKDNENYEKRDH
jgi:uncharacterized membrane protein